MAKRKKAPGKRDLPQPANDSHQSAAAKEPTVNILARTNRGTLFDIVIFLGNIFLFRLLAKLFLDLFNDAAAGDSFAKLGLMLCALGIWILPGLGATLKRWHFHQRLEAEGESLDAQKNLLAGCLFNPIFYFCLNLLITAVVMTFLLSLLQPKGENNRTLFTASVFFGVGFAAFQTYLIYRYFSPPKSEPKAGFLRDPRSEIWGDICILLNMILLQTAWNLLPITMAPRPPNVSVSAEISFRLFVFGFASLLVYFPPRIFYLREDIKRARAWLTILLANLPVIVRLVIGAYDHS
jgi:hypothetical protein